MIIDARWDLGTGAAISLAGFTTAAKKGDAIDLGAAGKNAFGDSKANWLPEGWGLNVVCDVAMNTSATLTFNFLTSTLEALTGGTTSSLGTRTLTAVTLAAGDVACFIPADTMVTMQRYVGMFVTSDTSLGTCSVRAWIGPQMETPVAPTNFKK